MSAVLVALVATGSAHASPVTKKSTAVSIAETACYESWGKYVERNGIPWRHYTWHARVEGDHWRAWVGKESDPDMSIDVPREGTPVDPGLCDLKFSH